MKGYEGLSQPFTMLIYWILISYIRFVKGEGLTDEFLMGLFHNDII